MASLEELEKNLTAGDTRALARACRLVDDDRPERRELVRRLAPLAKNCWFIGVTGGPGAGKSTLVDRLVSHLRKSVERVGVVAVDPSSPFSGGAILGDRIRLQRHFEDDGVFIRSVATRGALGGLSRSTLDIGRLVAAWGARVVLIETVGVGQDELDIMLAAQTTCVVVAPGMGDDVQAIKAGVLECADVLVVNKADRPGAQATQRDLESMVALGRPLLPSSAGRSGHAGHAGSTGHAGGFGTAPKGGSSELDPGEEWVLRVLPCVATEDRGVTEVLERLTEHQRWLCSTKAGAERTRERLHQLLKSTLRDTLSQHVEVELADAIESFAARIERGELDIYAALDALLAQCSLS